MVVHWLNPAERDGGVGSRSAQRAARGYAPDVFLQLALDGSDEADAETARRCKRARAFENVSAAS